MSHILIAARGKINWTLDVLERRPDGYHEVDTLLHSVDLADELRLCLNADGGIRIACNRAVIPTDARNLAYAAAHRLLRAAGRPELGVNISIYKRIPVGAGMAGGSADAAATLLGVNALLREDALSFEQLRAIAAGLGADVPFCMTGGLQRARGVGDALSPIACAKPLWVLLATPRAGLSTARVYAGWQNCPMRESPDTPGAIAALARGDVRGLADSLGNSLHPVARAMCAKLPPLERAMSRIGAAAVSMTGSGPTLFGLFETPSAARAGLDKLRAQGVQAWCRVVRTARRGWSSADIPAAIHARVFNK